jgi:hypothetical protein
LLCFDLFAHTWRGWWRGYPAFHVATINIIIYHSGWPVGSAQGPVLAAAGVKMLLYKSFLASL